MKTGLPESETADANISDPLRRIAVYEAGVCSQTQADGLGKPLPTNFLLVRSFISSSSASIVAVLVIIVDGSPQANFQEPRVCAQGLRRKNAKSSAQYGRRGVRWARVHLPGWITFGTLETPCRARVQRSRVCCFRPCTSKAGCHGAFQSLARATANSYARSVVACHPPQHLNVFPPLIRLACIASHALDLIRVIFLPRITM